jgi:hypothetical protein
MRLVELGVASEHFREQLAAPGYILAGSSVHGSNSDVASCASVSGQGEK